MRDTETANGFTRSQAIELQDHLHMRRFTNREMLDLASDVTGRSINDLLYDLTPLEANSIVAATKSRQGSL